MFVRFKYHALVLLAGLSWSTLAIFSAYLTRFAVDVFNQVFWRFIFGSAIAFLAAYVLKQKITIKRTELPYLLINAGIFIFAYITFAAAIYFGTPIAKAVVLNYSYPIPVILLSYFLLRDKPTPKNILAVLISLISLALLLEVWTIQSLTTLHPGDVYAWLNSAFFAGIIVWGTKIRRETSLAPLTTLAFSFLLSIPLFVVLGYMLQPTDITLLIPTIVTSYPFSVWLLFAGLGAFAAVIPVTLLYISSGKLKPVVNSVLLLTEVVGVYLWQVLIFGQQLSPWAILGAAGILISVLLT